MKVHPLQMKHLAKAVPFLIHRCDAEPSKHPHQLSTGPFNKQVLKRRESASDPYPGTRLCFSSGECEEAVTCSWHYHSGTSPEHIWLSPTFKCVPLGLFNLLIIKMWWCKSPSAPTLETTLRLQYFFSSWVLLPNFSLSPPPPLCIWFSWCCQTNLQLFSLSVVSIT